MIPLLNQNIFFKSIVCECLSKNVCITLYCLFQLKTRIINILLLWHKTHLNAIQIPHQQFE